MLQDPPALFIWSSLQHIAQFSDWNRISVFIYTFLYIWIEWLWMSSFSRFTHLLRFFFSEQLPDKTCHLPEPRHRTKTARKTERHHQKTSGVDVRCVVFKVVSLLQTQVILSTQPLCCPQRSKHFLFIACISGLCCRARWLRTRPPAPMLLCLFLQVWRKVKCPFHLNTTCCIYYNVSCIGLNWVV